MFNLFVIFLFGIFTVGSTPVDEHPSKQVPPIPNAPPTNPHSQPPQPQVQGARPQREIYGPVYGYDRGFYSGDYVLDKDLFDGKDDGFGGRRSFGDEISFRPEIIEKVERFDRPGFGRGLDRDDFGKQFGLPERDYFNQHNDYGRYFDDIGRSEFGDRLDGRFYNGQRCNCYGGRQSFDPIEYSRLDGFQDLRKSFEGAIPGLCIPFSHNSFGSLNNNFQNFNNEKYYNSFDRFTNNLDKYNNYDKLANFNNNY